MHRLFNLFRAITQQLRANRHYSEIRNVDIETISAHNFKALKARLKNCEGPYTPEMLDHLKTKKDISAILTLEERALLKSLLIDSPWKLTHGSTSIKEIRASGKILSTQQLKKKAASKKEDEPKKIKGDEPKKIKKCDELPEHPPKLERVEPLSEKPSEPPFTSHTPVAEGTTDCVFFSIGLGDEVEISRFLGNTSEYIEVDYELMEDSQALKGIWGSPHLFSHKMEDTGDSLKIYNAHYEFFYQIQIDPKTGKNQFCKICRYKHPDGRVKERSIPFESEIFMESQIPLALALLTIEHLRLLGKETWSQAMQIKDLKEKQALVNTFCHPGAYELHKPAEFSIQQPGVVIKPYQPSRKDPTIESPECLIGYSLIDCLPEEIGEAIFNEERLDMKLVQEKLLLENTNIDTPMKLYKKIRTLRESMQSPQPLNTVNFFNVAIYVGNLEVVKQCLDLGADLTVDIGWQLGGSYEYITDPIESALALGSYHFQSKHISFLRPVHYDIIKPSKHLARFITNFRDIPVEYLHSDSKKAIEVIELLLKYGSKNKKNSNIRTLMSLTPRHIESACYVFKVRNDLLLYMIENTKMKPSEIPLCAVIAAGYEDHDSEAVIEAMLKRGADPNQVGIPGDFSDFFKEGTPGPFEEGSTPLSVAIKNKFPSFVKLLLKHKADVNQLIYRKDSTSFVKLLVQNKADVNQLIYRKESTDSLLLLAVRTYISSIPGDTPETNPKAEKDSLGNSFQALENIKLLVAAGANLEERIEGKNVFAFIHWYRFTLKRYGLDDPEIAKKWSLIGELQDFLIKSYLERTKKDTFPWDLLDTQKPKTQSSRLVKILLTGLNEKAERVIVKPKETNKCFPTDLPYFVIPTSDFSKEKWTKQMFQDWELDLMEKETQWEEFCHLVDSSIHVCNLGENLSKSLKKLKYLTDDFEIVLEEEVSKEHQIKFNSLKSTKV